MKKNQYRSLVSSLARNQQFTDAQLLNVQLMKDVQNKITWLEEQKALAEQNKTKQEQM